MKKNKKAFSLIEVIVASIILTIAVFGVNKLIAENSKLINNSDNFVFANTLVYPLQECIDNLGVSTFDPSTTTEYNFNFGTDGNGCETGTSNHVIYDNIEYELSGIITNYGSDYIDWDLSIEGEGIGVVNKNYTLKK